MVWSFPRYSNFAVMNALAFWQKGSAKLYCVATEIKLVGNIAADSPSRSSSVGVYPLIDMVVDYNRVQLVRELAGLAVAVAISERIHFNSILPSGVVFRI